MNAHKYIVRDATGLLLGKCSATRPKSRELMIAEHLRSARRRNIAAKNVIKAHIFRNFWITYEKFRNVIKHFDGVFHKIWKTLRSLSKI